MNFTAKFAGSLGALWAELESALRYRAVVYLTGLLNFTDAVCGGSLLISPRIQMAVKKWMVVDGKCGSLQQVG